MALNTEEWTGDEACEHVAWCDATLKKLRELSDEDARSWWENECQEPDWLEIEREAGESIESFAERLEQEKFDWVERAIVRYADEEAAEEEGKKKARRTLESRINGKRDRLEHVRLCQKTAEADRMVELSYRCGFLYLKKQLRVVRTPNCAHCEERPDSPHKIGRTMRIKKRNKELRRDLLVPVCEYATVVPIELEKSVHLHFGEFRIKRGKERQKGERKYKTGETFRLPPAAVETFKETVAKVEKWVLMRVEAELELEILRAEAMLSTWKAAKA